MKISRRQLRRIIKEEAAHLVLEAEAGWDPESADARARVRRESGA